MSAAFSRRPAASNAAAHLSAAAGALAGTAGSLQFLFSNARPFKLVLPALIPLTRLEIVVDGLAVVFILVISLVALAASIYALGYTREYYGKKNLGFLGAMYNLFLLSMTLVVTAGNALLFLMLWELMTLVSYLLVVFDHQNPNVRRAGFVYIVMTHVGTAFILLAFLIFFRYTGSFNFVDFAKAANRIPALMRDLAFIFALIGFGTKAGIVPLHIWLPLAHPAAPSHVSALMSGVMIKTAVYALMRLLLDILGTGPLWWGLLILLIGATSALLGILYALMQNNLKQLLAFSSVENVGIIFLGLGVAVASISFGRPELAALGTVAALYHLLNHGIFKSLLFLSSGAVLQATHTKDMEKLGGLLKKMPWTGFFFLVGAVAISALPPLNGLISEWLTFQSLLQLGFHTPAGLVRILAPVGGAALALTGALAAAGFVKAFGITFLAQPRSPRVLQAREAAMSMRLGMWLLALAALLLGVFPALAIRLLDPAVVVLTGRTLAERASSWGWLTLAPLDFGFASFSPFIIALLLVGLAPLPFLLAWLAGGRARRRVGETWNCGVTLEPVMEYTGASFSKPFRIIFRKVFRP
ncbi:MAG: proton-conducting transporter membrane subunit, partial [Syntrophothermus sp.]